MDALRVRLGSALEWAVAVAFFAATLVVALQILQDVRQSADLRAASPAAVAAVSDIPQAVPHGAVSIPELSLAGGATVRVGDTASAVAAALGRGAGGREQMDRGRLGARLTRFYDYGGFRFVLVYEPFERNGERRVSAIYLP